MKKLLALIWIIFPLFSWAQSYLPKSSGSIVKHHYYTLSYNEQKEQANWVYYHLTAKEIDGTAKRANNFRPDPSVKTGSAKLSDYQKSGYDRGHLCPAAAMKLNTTSMSESFFLSNMSPQVPGFNRGIWKDLEAQVRAWTLLDGDLYVVSGPVFKDDKGTIGIDKVTIPGYYYKVIYDAHHQQMIAFILPNQASNTPLSSFEVTVDHLEALTGIDFFPELPDSLENKLEKNTNFSSWHFSQHTQTKSHSATASPYYHGHQLRKGPKGGYYYINKNGNKTYVSKSKIL